MTSPKPADALKDALSSFSNPLIWLIGVAVMISYGLTKTGLGARIGYYFISLFVKTLKYRLCVDASRAGIGTDYPIKHSTWGWDYSSDYAFYLACVGF